jgi:hypothetical protein
MIGRLKNVADFYTCGWTVHMAVPWALFSRTQIRLYHCSASAELRYDWVSGNSCDYPQICSYADSPVGGRRL